MSELNLHKALATIDINADWVGLREVKEATTYRVIRDGNPQANSRDINHGVMIEVLADGQFGYYGCSNLNHENIQKGAEKALKQAKTAAKNPIFKFTEDARPMTKGSFQSPYNKSVDEKKGWLEFFLLGSRCNSLFCSLSLSFRFALLIL